MGLLPPDRDGAVPAASGPGPWPAGGL